MAEHFNPILVYHKVDERFEWGITRVTPAQFEAQVRYLAENNYQSLTLSEYEALPQEKRIKQDNRYVVITFDDAYQNIYSKAYPILKKYKFIATIFVIADFIGKYNTWDVNLGGRRFKHLNLQELKVLVEEGFEIGSHSRTHPDLTRLSFDACYDELYGSKAIIEDLLNKNVNYISYPFGITNRQVIEATKLAGYEKGCVLHNTGSKYDHSDVIQRQAVYLIDNLISFRAKLQENRFHPWENYKLRLINSGARATIFVKSFRKT